MNWIAWQRYLQQQKSRFRDARQVFWALPRIAFMHHKDASFQWNNQHTWFKCCNHCYCFLFFMFKMTETLQWVFLWKGGSSISSISPRKNTVPLHYSRCKLLFKIIQYRNSYQNEGIKNGKQTGYGCKISLSFYCFWFIPNSDCNLFFFENAKNTCVILAFISVGNEYQERFVLTTFHSVTNLAKDLIFLLEYLHAYKPSHKHNGTTVKVPCTVKVVIPLHVYDRAHLSKSTWGLFILNYYISQVKLLDCMNWDHCYLQFHGIKLNSHERERINSYVTSQWLFWALPLHPAYFYMCGIALNTPSWYWAAFPFRL